MIVSADLSQIEMRTAALLSGDEVLLRIFGEDRDVHTELTILVEGGEVVNHPGFGSGDRLTDPRQWYKQANFLMLYKGGWEKLRYTMLKLTGRWFAEELCRRIVDGTRAAYKGVGKWQDGLIGLVKGCGYLQLPFTFRRRYFKPWDVTNICNFPPQTTAADVMALDIMYYLHKHLAPLILPQDIQLFQNIHDAIKLDAKSSKDVELAKELIEGAIRFSEEEGLWSKLQDLYERKVPLRYGLKIME